MCHLTITVIAEFSFQQSWLSFSIRYGNVSVVDIIIISNVIVILYVIIKDSCLPEFNNSRLVHVGDTLHLITLLL